MIGQPHLDTKHNWIVKYHFFLLVDESKQSEDTRLFIKWCYIVSLVYQIN